MSTRAQKAADRIRTEISIVQVLFDYGYAVDPRGEDREQQFSCDLHGDGRDSKPSGRAYPGSGQFFCFACGRSRDTVTLVMEKESLTFWDAVRVLEKKYNLPPLAWDPSEGPPDTPLQEVENSLDNREKPDQALLRLARFLDGITRERSLDPQKCAGLWEAHDRIVDFLLQGGDPEKTLEMTHKVLRSAKQALHPTESP